MGQPGPAPNKHRTTDFNLEEELTSLLDAEAFAYEDFLKEFGERLNIGGDAEDEGSETSDAKSDANTDADDADQSVDESEKDCCDPDEPLSQLEIWLAEMGWVQRSTRSFSFSAVTNWCLQSTHSGA